MPTESASDPATDLPVRGPSGPAGPSASGPTPPALTNAAEPSVSEVAPAGPLATGPSAPVVETFVQLWGDMAAAWGINRTTASIHGLLYITGETLSAEEIMTRLNISRGNASMSLRSLLEWGVVRKVRRRGDRRDYFESLSDVWQIFSHIAQQRKRKEVDPALATLRDCHRELKDRLPADGEVSEADRVCRERLEQMVDVLSLLDRISRKVVGSEKMLALAIGLLAGDDPE